MQKLTDTETRSRDLIADNIATLRALFPELLTEGPKGASINLDVLKALVGDQTVTDADEKYGLNWHGKRKARLLALTPSTGTLRPCPEESVDWDTTQNLLIEGDNLEVLKLLQKSYAGKVKLIYIDPPYNTGKDFVYPDDFRDNIRNYMELTGQVDGEGRKLSSNPETSGRFHTDWLNMMYPRLKLARELLREDGAIVISIDDGEVDNLRKLCGEIFGEENFVTTIIWQKKYAPANDAKWLSDNHDYLLLVARDKDVWRPNLLPRTEEANARYSNPDGDPRGPWKPGGIDVKTYSPTYDYEIETPSGRLVRPPPGACWRYSRERFAELVRDNRISFGRNGASVPAIKRFLSEVKQGITPLTIWTYDEVGHNQEATQELKALGIHSFDSPKPVRLLSRVLQICTSEDDIVLDFFAGSGSMGHAVLSWNKAVGGSRRFILVQLPEPLDEASREKGGLKSESLRTTFRTIFDITKERIRRVGASLNAENGADNLDIGFRVFELSDSNLREWDPRPGDLLAALAGSVGSVKPGRTERDLLFEILLRLGLDLSCKIEEAAVKSTAGRTHRLSAMGGGTLIACLSARIDTGDVQSIVERISSWVKELEPFVEPTLVFRDAAFDNDVSKLNMLAALQQCGFDQVRSI